MDISKIKYSVQEINQYSSMSNKVQAAPWESRHGAALYWATETQPIDFSAVLREHSWKVLSQWGMKLHCNIASHWLIPYPEWCQGMGQSYHIIAHISVKQPVGYGLTYQPTRNYIINKENTNTERKKFKKLKLSWNTHNSHMQTVLQGYQNGIQQAL